MEDTPCINFKSNDQESVRKFHDNWQRSSRGFINSINNRKLAYNKQLNCFIETVYILKLPAKPPCCQKGHRRARRWMQTQAWMVLGYETEIKLIWHKSKSDVWRVGDWHWYQKQSFPPRSQLTTIVWSAIYAGRQYVVGQWKEFLNKNKFCTNTFLNPDLWNIRKFLWIIIIFSCDDIYYNW